MAENVEFYKSTLGEKRRGCTAIDLPVTITADADIDAVTWMFRHLPTNDEGVAQLWVLGQSLDASDNILTYRNQTTWNTVTPVNAIVSTSGKGHRLSAVTLHGKLFIAYDSSVDRLHVWDGSTLRATGLAEPAAPTGANSAPAGTFAGTRYYRVRYTIQSAGVTLRRSEPSDTLTFAPSGTKTGIVVTKPATISESETHWELEASKDNANFYVLATTLVGTTTVTDTTDYNTGYAISYDLAEDIGDYTLIPSGRFLSVDEDRLVIAGSWENSDEGSRVRWTPVGLAPGSGNDERLEDDTDPFIDLDGSEGGDITGLSRAVNGYLFAFKWSHIYKIVRTGTRASAYTAIPVTKAKGALPGSLVEAVDQSGQPAQYFLEPRTGPHRLGSQGLQWCSADIQTLWATVNVDAIIPCHGVYDHIKQQIHWWLAINGSDYPNAKIVLHLNEMRNTSEGAKRGWVTVPEDDVIAVAHCSTMFAANIDSTDAREFTLRPLIGKETWDASTDLVQLCDTGSTDAGTSFRGRVKTKPFMWAGLMNHSEILAGAILTNAAEDEDDTIHVRVTADYGTNTDIVSTDMNPEGSEDHVIKQLDDLKMSEAYVLQLEIGDLDEDVDPASYYQVDLLALKRGKGQTA